MSGLFAGTPLERPVTCEHCGRTLDDCKCPRDAVGRVLLPRDQPARVTVEKRRYGKMVTRVVGLDDRASDLLEIAQKLKGRCGAGGTVREGAIEVQGDHREAAAALLDELGYPVRS